MKYLKIPQERIGVLIGHNGETRKMIEQISNTNIQIDSKEGEVVISKEESCDPFLFLKTEDVIRAIGRGFSPENAIHLLKDDMEFFLFDIYDYVGKKDNHVRRLKSRIIGKNGKTKKNIENLTSSYLSIYGHTIGVIADFMTIGVVKRAIDMLLNGSTHATVYRYLEREIKNLRLADKMNL